jgi:hypothetical protein
MVYDVRMVANAGDAEQVLPFVFHVETPQLTYVGTHQLFAFVPNYWEAVVESTESLYFATFLHVPLKIVA